MIKRDPIIEKILLECQEIIPFYEHKILSFVEEKEVRDVFGELEEVIYSEPSLCAQFSTIAIVLCRMMKKGDYDVASKIFTLIEEILKKADDQLSGELEICFFEDIMNIISNQEEGDEGNIDKDRVYSLLGPISRELCRRNDEFWGTKIF